jgi:hypothetical protein
MLFDTWQSDRLILCIDPASFDLIQDFNADKAEVRLLEIECDFSDDWLLGHARRVGLAGAGSAPATIERLLPTIRHDIRFESERLREAGFARFQRIRQSATVDENTVPLAQFLDIPTDKARDIVATPYLFAD